MVSVLGLVLAAAKAGFCSVDSMGFFLLCFTFLGIGRPGGGLNPELLRVLRVQPLPTFKLHRIAACNAAKGISAEEAIQNIERYVPPGSTHRDEPAIDFVPQGQASAAARGFEF